MSLTESKIYDAAIHYLQRYAAPVAQLRRVLQRKIIRAQIKGEEVPADIHKWIEKAVEKCVSQGFVDDKIFTEQKVQSMRRQGKARMFIANTLQQKGVEKILIHEALIDDTDAEFEAAKKTVKRKRLGTTNDPEKRQKDLAKLMRAGFSMDIARKALATGLIDKE